MKSVADGKEYADFLGTVPAFSNCPKEVLEDFIVHGAFKVHAAAGGTLCAQTQCDQNLYVLLSGSASLDAGDGVRVALRPGDYFGKNPGRHHELIGTVKAERDVEILVIRPQESLQLEMATSRHRHPSKIEWRNEITALTPPAPGRRLRALVTT